MNGVKNITYIIQRGKINEFQNVQMKYYLNSFKENLDLQPTNFDNTLFIVYALINTEIIGHAEMINKQTAEITSVFVKKDHNGNGICFNLVTRLVEEATEAKISTVYLSNAGGIAGFKCYARAFLDNNWSVRFEKHDDESDPIKNYEVIKNNSILKINEINVNNLNWKKHSQWGLWMYFTNNNNKSAGKKLPKRIIYNGFNRIIRVDNKGNNYILLKHKHVKI